MDIRDIKVYYINLDKDINRNNSMIKMLDDNGFKNYERIPGFVGSNRVGCSLSHIKALELAIKNNIYPYIILEDDVEIYNNNFIVDIPDDSDALYLGISSYGSDVNEKTKVKELLYIKNLDSVKHLMVNMVCRHAVIHVNKKYDIDSIKYNKLFIKNKNGYCAGDVAISNLNKQKKVYCLNVPIFYQGDIKNIESTKRTIYDVNFILV